MHRFFEIIGLDLILRLDLKFTIPEPKLASNISQKGHFFAKRGTKILPLYPFLIPFLSVLHQNKALYNFHERGQRPIDY